MNAVHPSGRGCQTFAPLLLSLKSKYQHPPRGRTGPYSAIGGQQVVPLSVTTICSHLFAVRFAGDDDDLHVWAGSHGGDPALQNCETELLSGGVQRLSIPTPMPFSPGNS